MNLVIHDLKKEEWDTVRDDYADCIVISDQGTIRPCTGCFGCWNRDPGRYIRAYVMYAFFCGKTAS